MIQQLINFLMPTSKEESPKWAFQLSRLLLSLTLLVTPIVYDKRVPEVAGDPRWVIAHWVTLLLAIITVFTFMNGKRLNFKMPISAWAAIAVGLTACISLIDAINPVRGWWALQHLLAYIGLFSFILIYRDKNWYRNLFWIIAIGVAFNAVLGISQFFNITDATIATVIPFWGKGVPLLDYFRQAAPPGATLSNKNLVASYMVLTLPIMLYLLFTSTKRIQQIIAASCFTAGSLLLIYTRSRGGWVAATAMLIFFTLWVLLNKDNRELLKNYICGKRIAIFAIALIVVVTGSFLQTPLKNKHSISKGALEQAASLQTLFTGSGELGTRLAYNVNGSKIVLDNPFNGVGMGNFHTVYPLYNDAWAQTPHTGYNLKARPQRTHNDLMQAFIETGIIGGVAYLTFFLSLLWMGYKISRNTKTSKEAKALALFTVTGIVGLGVNSLGDFPLQMPTAPILMWSMAGVLTGIFMLTENKHSYGFSLPFSYPKISTYIATVCLIVIAAVVVCDNYTRYKGTIQLKRPMSLSYVGVNSDETLSLIRKSFKTYPYNQRLREYYGVITTNHRGTTPVSASKKIEAGRTALKYDPYSGNTIINLVGQLMIKFTEAYKLGGSQKAIPYLKEAEEYIPILDKVLKDTPEVNVLAGFIAINRNNYVDAQNRFLAALRKAPNMPQAQRGMALVNKHFQEKFFSKKK